MLHNDLELQVVAEDALLVCFANAKSCVGLPEQSQHTTLSLNDKNAMISSIFNHILNAKPTWLIDLTPAYETLLITYNIFLADQWLVKTYVREILNEMSTVSMSDTGRNSNGLIHRIPVLYGGDDPSRPHDVSAVCDLHNISESALVTLHNSCSYKVYAVGFLPNFAYLGELPDKLNTPRLSSPRTKVPAGAVAIADKQTAIYPQQSQGGWHIVGYTPLSLDSSINKQSHHQNLHEQVAKITFKVGDTVEFFAIDDDEFVEIQQRENIYCAVK